MTEENKEDFELEWMFAEYGAGRAVSEIAKELGKSEGYVYARMRRRPDKYEDVKRIREENHNVRIRRIRGLADKRSEKHDIPEGLDWDLWLGPAKMRAYNEMYLPGSWRGWMPYGSGTIGDWVCHVVDPVFWALDLGSPTTIQAQAKGYDPKKHANTFPSWSIVTFEFPAKGNRRPVKLLWHSATAELSRPADLEEDRKVVGTGAVVYGTKGTIMYGSHGAGGVRIIPEKKMQEYRDHLPDQTIPRVKGHHNDWLDSIKNGKQAGSNFDFGGPLTEIARLGMIGLQLLGQKLEWDGANMRFTNSAEANALINPPMRKGWTL